MGGKASAFGKSPGSLYPPPSTLYPLPSTRDLHHDAARPLPPTVLKARPRSSVEHSQFDPPLQPELREAAETLEQALTEACAGKSAREADTGELIKVEEMLALAGDAARRAIAIRRKAREQAG